MMKKCICWIILTVWQKNAEDSEDRVISFDGTFNALTIMSEVLDLDQKVDTRYEAPTLKTIWSNLKILSLLKSKPHGFFLYDGNKYNILNPLKSLTGWRNVTL